MASNQWQIGLHARSLLFIDHSYARSDLSRGAFESLRVYIWAWARNAVVDPLSGMFSSDGNARSRCIPRGTEKSMQDTCAKRAWFSVRHRWGVCSSAGILWESRSMSSSCRQLKQWFKKLGIRLKIYLFRLMPKLHLLGQISFTVSAEMNDLNHNFIWWWWWLQTIHLYFKIHF